MLPVVDGRPPNFPKIQAVLPEAAGAGVMFAYGGKVYAPGRTSIPRELDAHEQVHVDRQGADPDAWWERYLADISFRYEEELLAYRAEYQVYCKRHLDPIKRVKMLRSTAARLSSPLYGNLVGREAAERAILDL